MARPDNAKAPGGWWDIYRYEGNGVMRYLGCTDAKDQKQAMKKARALLPEEKRDDLMIKKRQT
jgi:hypothetical protein